MIKGTTPILHYDLPFETSAISTAEIVLEYVDNNKKILIVKDKEKCTLGDKSIEAVLTQEETLQIPAPSFVYVQLRIKTTDGTILATEAQKVSVKRLLKESVIE